jgi:hypothetical protein
VHLRLPAPVTRRWAELDGDARAAAVGLAVALAGAIAIRVWLMLAYAPGFVGFSDTHDYLTAALVGVFHDVEKRPAIRSSCASPTPSATA